MIAPQRARGRIAPSVALAAVVLASVIAAAALREVSLGKVEMAAADEAAARSDWDDAIWHARAAAEAFVPGSPWPERGMKRLDAIAHDAATRGDRPVALLAYGALRTAALAARAPSSPNTGWRSRAEDGLAQLAASPDVPAAHESANAMRADLKDLAMPSLWTLSALSASVLTILVGLAGLARGVWPSPRAFAAKVLIGVGFATYAAALLLS